MMRYMSEMATAGDVLELVRTGQAATRSDVSRITGLSRTAVVSRVSALVDAGLLVLAEGVTSTGGRPPGALLFNQDAGVVLGVAVGRSRSQLGVFDLEGRELAGDTRDHEIGVSAEELMPALVERLATMLTGIESPAVRRVVGIGMSLPGVVDPVGRVSIDAPVMRGWDGVPLAPFFAPVTEAPLFLGNDAEVLARSELFGPGPHFSDALVVKASTGLGLGIIVGGTVVTGHRGAAGELGHTRLDSAGDRPCRCGSTGCLETVAAGWSLVQQLVGSGVEAGHIRDLVALALAGDAVARGLLRESGRYLGEVLAVAINMLNPEAVVLGGDMGTAFDLYVAGVREAVYARSAALVTRDLVFVPSKHSDSSGLVGCAALAIEQVLDPSRLDLFGVTSRL
jgi:predicted NBD/HSP70 family sugar kinase